MKKIKKIIIFPIALILILSSFITINADFDTSSYSWYAKRNKNHVLPTNEKQFSFISKYDALYGDEKSSKENEKVIYLTFDAGYENGNIEKILNILNSENVPGAFFVLENFVINNPNLIERMDKEGHLICNHTRSHPDMSKITSKDTFEKQLTDLNNAVIKITGHECAKYYRPPEGRFSEQNLAYAKELGYKTIFWSFAYADWDNKNQPCEEIAMKKILDNIHPGEIMLLHPTSSTNAKILEKLIKTLKNDGYRFGSLDEIVIENNENINS